MKIRYDKFEQYEKKFNHDNIPCIIYSEVNLTALNYTPCANYHEDLELQLFTAGEGNIFINGENYHVRKNDIVVINSNMVHHTNTDTSVTYYPLIINSKFCKTVDINCSLITFETLINSPKLIELFNKVVETYYSDINIYKKAKMQAAILNLMIELCDNHCLFSEKIASANSSCNPIEKSIKFIREHYKEKLKLDTIAQNVHMDKYNLSRKFKAFTGLTIIDYINNYRCEMAKELIRQGCPVSEAAEKCGFNNMSFFTKTFKHHTGKLPSSYKNKHNGI